MWYTLSVLSTCNETGHFTHQCNILNLLLCYGSEHVHELDGTSTGSGTGTATEPAPGQDTTKQPSPHQVAKRGCAD
jgi:hypothetical protein